MFSALILWFLLSRGRARRGAAMGAGIVNPWTGRELPAGTPDPWGGAATAAPLVNASSTVQPAGMSADATPAGRRDAATARAAAVRASAASRRRAAAALTKLSWLVMATNASSARATATEQLDLAVTALLQTGPLVFQYASVNITPVQGAGTKWYATVDVPDAAARGRLRAQLARTPGVQLAA